jgi:N-carbamoyl-L-amino-acid hydrolase
MTRTVRIDRDRLWATLMELKHIGAYDDGPPDSAAFVVSRSPTPTPRPPPRRAVMAESRLKVRIDKIGNVYATRPARDRSLPCLLMGSRIDTVATGGAFDGTLCVLGGIEVICMTNHAGIKTLRDVEVGFFSEEEGVRFGTDMLGSAVTASGIPLDRHRPPSLTDCTFVPSQWSVGGQADVRWR